VASSTVANDVASSMIAGDVSGYKCHKEDCHVTVSSISWMGMRV
jgi:hypothetical protein